MTTRTTLVIGGTGKTGRRVVERLAARGLPVRIGSRSSEPPFDWEDPATWASAMNGVGAVYLTYYPDLAVPGAVDAVRGVVDLALERGARRIVLLSGRGEEEAERAEAVVQGSGIDWTILRCSWFAQNFSESYLREPLVGGEVVLPTGDVAEPFVDADDIADVAVAALTEDGHVGRLYELTGPRMLTFPEAVAEIAAATGREIRYARVSPERVCCRAGGGGRTVRVRVVGELLVHHSPRRPQCQTDGRRPAGAGAGAKGLRRLRAGGSRRRRQGRVAEIGLMMLDDALFAVTIITALACGLVGGVFFGFSAFIMRALARLPAAQGIAAMQSINVVVINPWFMTPFVGTAAAAALLIVSALFGWGDLDATFVLIGAALYLVGTFGVTIALNVPRNDALAAVEPDGAEGAAEWSRYVPSWTAWNTVRTIAALAAAASLTIALVVE